MNTNVSFSNCSGTPGISQTWKTPTHPKISGPKSLGLGSFFLPDQNQTNLNTLARASHGESLKTLPSDIAFASANLSSNLALQKPISNGYGPSAKLLMSRSCWSIANDVYMLWGGGATQVPVSQVKNYRSITRASLHHKEIKTIYHRRPPTSTVDTDILSNAAKPCFLARMTTS